MSWRETMRSSLQAHNMRVKEHLIIFYSGTEMPIGMKRPEEGTMLHRLLLDAGILGVFSTMIGDPVENPELLSQQHIIVHVVKSLKPLVQSKIPQAITGGLITLADGLLYNANATLWVVTKKQKVPPELKEMKKTRIPENAEIWKWPEVVS